MSKEAIVNKDERVVNDRMIPLSEVMRIASETGVNRLKPNKLPSWMQHIMAVAQANGNNTATKVSVSTNPTDGVERDGVVVLTADNDREKNLTGYDIVWKDYNRLKKEKVLVRIPLSRMRADQIRLADEKFQPTPTAKGRKDVAKVTKEDLSLTQEDLKALGV